MRTSLTPQFILHIKRNRPGADAGVSQPLVMTKLVRIRSQKLLQRQTTAQAQFLPGAFESEDHPGDGSGDFEQRLGSREPTPCVIYLLAGLQQQSLMSLFTNVQCRLPFAAVVQQQVLTVFPVRLHTIAPSSFAPAVRAARAIVANANAIRFMSASLMPDLWKIN